jgi:hypothetical protein
MNARPSAARSPYTSGQEKRASPQYDRNSKRTYRPGVLAKISLSREIGLQKGSSPEGNCHSSEVRR